MSIDHPVLALERFLPYRLNSLAEKISRDFAQHYRDRFGLTRPEWRTLATLGQFGSRTATEIGAHSAMHKTKVSRAVFALEKRRWLHRRVNASDRRIEHLELTKEGRAIYDDLVLVAARFEQDLAERLGAEGAKRVDQALAILEALFPPPEARAGSASPQRRLTQ